MLRRPYRWLLTLSLLLTPGLVVQRWPPAMPGEDHAKPEAPQSMRRPAPPFGPVLGARASSSQTSDEGPFAASSPSMPFGAALYPQFVHWMQTGTPASLAEARRVSRACTMAKVAQLARRDPQRDLNQDLADDFQLHLAKGEAADVSLQRREALARSTAACGPLRQDRWRASALHEHASSVAAQQLRHSPQLDALGELLAQQDYDGATRWLMRAARSGRQLSFEGRPWGGVNPETFELALYLAVSLDPRPSAAWATQLLKDAACLDSGHCPEAYDAAYLLPQAPDATQLEQAWPLARRLFRAWSAQQLAAFAVSAAP
ncbi:hypothetical protein [Roseateles flavus]|uniref:Sel1 repeat family protein n=1 Tax=Roseateles flavus TaxID=3149041 RepID=A0ABV0GHG6_9BURK